MPLPTLNALPLDAPGIVDRQRWDADVVAGEIIASRLRSKRTGRRQIAIDLRIIKLRSSSGVE